MECMPVYQYILETEFERYHYYFSYDIEPTEMLEMCHEVFDGRADLYDMFPEPHTKKGVLKEPLKVITSIGKEMYLPVGFDIEIISKFRLLFQYNDGPL